MSKLFDNNKLKINMNMCSMKLTPAQKSGIRIDEQIYSQAIIYRGTPKADTPKTYKQVGGFVANELCSRYSSGCVTIYKAKNNTLRYSVYQDGCFYPYYGKIELVK